MGMQGAGVGVFVTREGGGWAASVLVLRLRLVVGFRLC